jgi:hypothetical protein
VLPAPKDASFFGAAEPTVDLCAERRELLTIGVQPIQVLRDVLVPLELGTEHRRRRPDIAQSGVRLLVLTAQIEACRGGEVSWLLAGCDLCGFNIRRFDLHMLIAEFKRCDIRFALDGRRVLDMQNIFHREELVV